MIRFAFLFALALHIGGAHVLLSQSAEEMESQSLARKKSIQSSVKRVAAMARREDIPGLLKGASSDQNPYHRVVCGYALFRIDPAKFEKPFLRSFRSTTKAPLWLSELQAFPEEMPAPKFPRDPKPFSYWSVSEALLKIARTGNRRALEIWLTFVGGDGEFGEGRSEDFTMFFLDSPKAVLKSWAVIRKHEDEIWHWGHLPAAIKQSRSKYLKLMSPKDPRRAEVMAIFDNLIALSTEESNGIEEPK